MTSLESILRDVTRAVTDAGIPFALIGGLAVSVRTEPRFTRDADLAVSVATDADAEALVHRLQSTGFVVHSALEQSAARRLATVRLSRFADLPGPVVDLLFASSGIEPEVAADAESLELLPGLHLPVARLGHLIALKVLSRDDARRPQDLVDLRALVSQATMRERDRAHQAVAMITARGFHRGRDLVAGLADIL